MLCLLKGSRREGLIATRGTDSPLFMTLSFSYVSLHHCSQERSIWFFIRVTEVQSALFVLLFSLLRGCQREGLIVLSLFVTLSFSCVSIRHCFINFFTCDFLSHCFYFYERKSFIIISFILFWNDTDVLSWFRLFNRYNSIYFSICRNLIESTWQRNFFAFVSILGMRYFDIRSRHEKKRNRHSSKTRIIGIDLRRLSRLFRQEWK